MAKLGLENNSLLILINKNGMILTNQKKKKVKEKGSRNFLIEKNDFHCQDPISIKIDIYKVERKI